MNKTNWNYAMIKEQYQNYQGVRYFKYNMNQEQVIQVVINPGETKKGRGNTFGIGTISKLTFFGNYMAYGHLDEITKSKYDKAFTKVVEALK